MHMHMHMHTHTVEGKKEEFLWLLLSFTGRRF